MLLVDDLVATGGTMLAGVELIRKLGGEVVEAAAIFGIYRLDRRQQNPRKRRSPVYPAAKRRLHVNFAPCLKGRLKHELAPKSWTLIKAYSGTLCKLGSVCDRTQLFQFQTATLPVVVIHIVIYLLHQFIYRQFTCVIETLRL